MHDIFKALGDMNRLKILSVLWFHELCVCEIEILLNLSQSNVSRHLAKLKSVGLICSSKEQQWVHYRIDENFKSENELLYKYLLNNFLNSNEFVELIKKSKRYKESPYTCETITNDKAFVFDFLGNK